MAGDQFSSRRNLPDNLSDVFDQALDTSAAIQVHKRKSTGEEIVAEVNDVR